MKGFLSSLTGFAIILFITSCSKVEEPERYLTFDGETHNLTVGHLDDWGTDSEITTRVYELGFGTSSTNAKDYISFDLYSNSTTRIQEGTYEYQYWAEKGNITSITVGLGISYDNTGQAISGTRYTESNSSFEGTVTISKKNDNYSFEFDLPLQRTMLSINLVVNSMMYFQRIILIFDFYNLKQLSNEENINFLLCGIVFNNACQRSKAGS